MREAARPGKTMMPAPLIPESPPARICGVSPLRLALAPSVVGARKRALLLHISF
jgi:hypothetical protein